MRCPECGATIPENSRFCNSCGNALPEPVPAPQPTAPPVAAPPAVAGPPVTPASTMVKPAKDPSTALLIELVGTLFGFMGLGWIYAGYTSRGITLLVVWLLVVVVAVVISALTAGIFACLWLPAQIAAAVISGLQVKQAVERDKKLV